MATFMSFGQLGSAMGSIPTRWMRVRKAALEHVGELAVYLIRENLDEGVTGPALDDSTIEQRERYGYSGSPPLEVGGQGHEPGSLWDGVTYTVERDKMFVHMKPGDHETPGGWPQRGGEPSLEDLMKWMELDTKDTPARHPVEQVLDLYKDDLLMEYDAHVRQALLGMGEEVKYRKR